MPYFPHFKLLFLHVPKTGGTSFENTMQEILHSEFFDWQESIHRYLQGDKKWQTKNLYGYEKVDGQEFALQHMKFSQMQEWNYLNGKEIQKIVIIIRHPYSRIVSEYKWRVIFGYKESFNYFVREAWQKKWHESRIFDQHLVPQCDFLEGIELNDPRLVIIRFENFAVNFDNFFNDMKIIYPEFYDAELRKDNESKDLLINNVNAKKNWKDFYANDAELLEILQKMYKNDFEKFKP